MPTIVLTNGMLLGDRDVRREAGEADTIVAWIPALQERSEDGDPHQRAAAWERHVEGVASLRRETPTRIALELPVRPGWNDGPESRAAWRRAAERTRPERVFVIPHPKAEGDPAVVLEEIRRAIHPKAGAFLSDGTLVDDRCFCESS